MISFDEATSLIARAAKPLEIELVSISDAAGRVLAEPVVAQISAPASDVSAMDGYAVRSADITGLPKAFEVVGESFAGAGYAGNVATDQAVRIFTGAPVPAGADRVIMQEYVARQGNSATLNEAPGSGRHVRSAGSDFHAGEELLPAGTRLGPHQLVAAAGADVEKLAVWRAPRIAILSTGDELVAPGTAHHTAGSIPDSVSFGVAALAELWGGEIVDKIRLPDDLDALEKAAVRVTEYADIVVVTGGASVGARDYAKAMFEPLGLDPVFSKVAIKPGKPVWTGRVGQCLIVGLPGNPTSAIVTARLFLAPLVAGLAGANPQLALQWQTVPLGAPLAATGDRETFVRGTLHDGTVEPLTSTDSGAQKVLALANCLVRCGAGMNVRGEGALVPVLEF